MRSYGRVVSFPKNKRKLCLVFLRERKAKATMSFITYPQKSHTAISTIPHWLYRKTLSVQPAQPAGEDLQGPHWRWLPQSLTLGQLSSTVPISVAVGSGQQPRGQLAMLLLHPASRPPGRHAGFPSLLLQPPVDSAGLSVSSVAQSCLTLYNPMDCSTPGFPVHHQPPEFTQTQVH